jgi:hypothetical protein
MLDRMKIDHWSLMVIVRKAAYLKCVHETPRNCFLGWNPKLMIQIWHSMFLFRISGLGGNRCPALNGVVAGVILNGSSMRVVVAMPQLILQKMSTTGYQNRVLTCFECESERMSVDRESQ